MKIAGLLLAAGESKRFGSDKRRAQLSNGDMLLARSLQNLTGAAIAQPLNSIIIPVRHSEPWLISLVGQVPAAQLLEVPDTQGVGDTLSAAIRYLLQQHCDGVIIALADMPCIQPVTLTKIIATLDNAPIVVPCYRGAWGHPVAFQARFFNALTRCQGDRGARWLLQQQRNDVTELEVEDPGILRDIDTPDQLASL